MSSVPNNITWQQFLDEFLSRFAEPTQAALTRLSNCDQDEYESVDSYADRFRRDMHLPGTQEDDALRYQFVAGLQRSLRFEVRRQHNNMHTLADIINTAKRWENYNDEDGRRPLHPKRSNLDNAGAWQPTATTSYIPPYRREQQPFNHRNGGFGFNARPYYDNGGCDAANNNQNDGQTQGYIPYGQGPRPNAGPFNSNRNFSQGPRPYDRPQPDYHPRPAAFGVYAPPSPLPEARAPANEIEDLSRQLERLQLNLAQMRRETRLLNASAAATYSMEYINTMEPLSQQGDSVVTVITPTHFQGDRNLRKLDARQEETDQALANFKKDSASLQPSNEAEPKQGKREALQTTSTAATTAEKGRSSPRQGEDMNARNPTPDIHPDTFLMDFVSGDADRHATALVKPCTKCNQETTHIYIMDSEQEAESSQTLTATSKDEQVVPVLAAEEALACTEDLSASENVAPTNYPYIRLAVEGNIASGKSSLLAQLAPQFTAAGWCVFPEPVEQWNRKGELNCFHATKTRPRNDKYRWQAAMELQRAIMRSYLERCPLPEKLIMERGPWSSLSVFTPAAKLHPTLMAELYEDAYRQRRLRSFLPDAIIYVDTPAEVCFQRMMNRGINYEADIELNYLTKVETLYKDALDGYDGFVYKFDGTLPKHILAQKVARLINHIYDLQQLTVDHPFPTFIPPALPKPSIQQELELAQYDLLITQKADKTPPVEPLTICTLPGGTALAALGQTRPDVPAPTTVYPTNFDLEVDALVLYQQGPGKLEFSKDFVMEYQNRYGVPPCIFDRIDCYGTVNIMGRLGFEASMGPNSLPALAVVSRRAMPGL